MSPDGRCYAGSKSSTALPALSSRRICFPPGPVTGSFSEAESGLLQLVYRGLQVVDDDHEAIPAAGLGPAPVGHWPGSGALRSAEPKREVSVRHDREGRAHPALQCEAEMVRVEGNRRIDVVDQVSHDSHCARFSLPSSTPAAPL